MTPYILVGRLHRNLGTYLPNYIMSQSFIYQLMQNRAALKKC